MTRKTKPEIGDLQISFYIFFFSFNHAWSLEVHGKAFCTDQSPVTGQDSVW